MESLQSPDVALGALLVVASVVDIRERILPDPLAYSIALCSLLSACMAEGIRGMACNLFWGGFTGAVVMLVELTWRRIKGAPGIGGGDIKLLLACMARDPFWGLASFSVGLIALAGAGCALSRRSLPLIPFFTAASIVTALWLGPG